MIFFDGEQPRTEGDEYVEITNLGSEPQQMEGWLLKDVETESPTFIFPAYVLEPGDSIKVYTNMPNEDFSFGYGRAIWNNSDPDTAELKDAGGKPVSTKSY